MAYIETLLNDFTVFRHIFETKDYPYLDKEYASAKNLLPVLDTKSVPFCQIKKTALLKPQARFLFIHTDAEKQRYQSKLEEIKINAYGIQADNLDLDLGAFLTKAQLNQIYDIAKQKME